MRGELGVGGNFIKLGAEPEPGMFGRAKGPSAPKSKRAAPERKHKVARSKARSAQ